MGLRLWFSNNNGSGTTTTTTTTEAAVLSPGSSDGSFDAKQNKKEFFPKHTINLTLQHTDSADSLSTEHAFPRSPRSRINSRDIPRTYSGLYGDDDLLPFECQRMQSGAIFNKSSAWFFLGTYACLLVVLQLVTEQLLPNTYSWTLTNAIHLVVTVVHVHWLKGNMADPQGEMSALTLWEQLVALGADAERVRQGLLILPVVLCYAACQFADYEPLACGVNFVLLAIALLAKSGFMNGVRIFGINRTVGIDDGMDEGNEEAEETAEVAADVKKND
jgi:hypothetical protein